MHAVAITEVENGFLLEYYNVGGKKLFVCSTMEEALNKAKDILSKDEDAIIDLETFLDNGDPAIGGCECGNKKGGE